MVILFTAMLNLNRCCALKILKSLPERSCVICIRQAKFGLFKTKNKYISILFRTKFHFALWVPEKQVLAYLHSKLLITCLQVLS